MGGPKRATTQEYLKQKEPDRTEPEVFCGGLYVETDGDS